MNKNEKTSLEKFKEMVRKTGYMYLEGERVSFSKEMLDAMDDESLLMYKHSSENWDSKAYRDSRCSIPGKNDKLIRCPETNHCNACPYTPKDPLGNPQPGERIGSTLSLELFEEMGVSISGDFNLEVQIEM